MCRVHLTELDEESLSFMLTFSLKFYISQVIPFARGEVSLCVLLAPFGRWLQLLGKCIILLSDFYKCKNSLFQASEFFLLMQKCTKISE